MEFVIELIQKSYGNPVKSTVLAFSLCLAAMYSSGFAQTGAEFNKLGSGRNYRIGVGDVLKVVVTKQELLSLDGVRVSNEGAIRLPMLNEDIRAACMTEVELAESIAQKYKKYVLEPQVYVSVQQFNSNPVALIGAVTAPGSFDIQRPTRLLELLAFVKGPAPNAGKTIQIIRTAADFQCADEKIVNLNGDDSKRVETEEILSVVLAETLKGNEDANPFVKAGDIISIAAADEPEEAYIIGNVVKPTSIKLTEPITLSKAIAMAGGSTKDAKIDKIKISRQDPKTLAKTEILINLKDINNDNKKDVLLQANDIIDVPGPKPSVLGKIFRTILPAVTRGIIPYPY